MAHKISKMIKDANALTDDEYLDLYRLLASKLSVTCPMLSKALKLRDYETAFCKLDPADKSTVIVNVLNVANGKSQGCNLRKVGGVSSAGFVLKNIASCLKDVVWIDPSVTGMFERRTRI